MAAVCEQCRAADKPLAPSRHLAPLQFCGVACRDLYIGETHRYRPCPDRDTHCLVPVGAPLAHLWRREVAPLLAKEDQAAMADEIARGATDHVLHRGLVEPIAAALQRIGPRGTKRGTPLAASDTPRAAGSDSDDDSDGDDKRQRPDAAPAPPAEVPPQPLMMHGAPSLVALLAAAEDDEVLRTWRAGVGTPLGRHLETQQFWDGRWRARLGDVFRPVERSGLWGRDIEMRFIGRETVDNFVSNPYAVFGGLAVLAALRALFDLLVVRLERSPRTKPNENVVQTVFHDFYHAAITCGSWPALRFVLTHRHAGTQGPSLHSKQLFRGVIHTLLQSEARLVFSRGVPWTPKGDAMAMSTHADSESMFYGHVAKLLRELIDWRDVLGRQVLFTEADTRFTEFHNLIIKGDTRITKLLCQIARINLSGDQTMPMQAVVHGDVDRLNALLQVVGPNGEHLDLRNVTKCSVIGAHTQPLKMFEIKKLTILRDWRHPASKKVGIDPVMLMSRLLDIRFAYGSYHLFTACVPLFANWRDPQTGNRIMLAEKNIIERIMQGAAELYHAAPEYHSLASEALRHLILSATTPLSDVVMQTSSGTLVETFLKYLAMLDTLRRVLSPATFVVHPQTFMHSLPPWLSTSYKTQPETTIRLWLRVLTIRTVDASGATHDVLAADWVRDNARLYFGRMSTTHGYDFFDRYNFNIPQDFWAATGAPSAPAPQRQRLRLNVLLRALWIQSEVAQYEDESRGEVAMNRAKVRDFLASAEHAETMRHDEGAVRAAYAADGVPLVPTAEEAALGLYRSAPLALAPPASASLSAAAAAATTSPLTHGTALSSLDN